MRIAVEPAVERWLDAQPPESVWTTITIFEIHFGLALLAQAAGIAPGHRALDEEHALGAFGVADDRGMPQIGEEGRSWPPN
jgi:hypothetical protein